MNHLELLKRSLQIEQKHDETDMSAFEYLSKNVFGFTTYHSEMEELFAKRALEVCMVISTGQTFQYQDDKGNYTWYLLMCNMPFFITRIDWGTSIRAAFWDNNADFEINSCGLYNENSDQITSLKFQRDDWDDFVKAMCDFTVWYSNENKGDD